MPQAMRLVRAASTSIARLPPEASLPIIQRVEIVCDRVDAIEPRLRSLLPEAGRRERLRREATTLEGGGTSPALRGLLLGVKDIMRADGFPTRCGSGLPAEAFEGAADLSEENGAVTAAKAAGALVLGKTHTTEFANMETAATTNPWDPTRTPGGSSQGSAAAVAAGASLATCSFRHAWTADVHMPARPYARTPTRPRGHPPALVRRLV